MIEALAGRACDYVMPDLSRIGGVRGWIQAAGIAYSARHRDVVASAARDQRAPARREPDLSLPRVCRLGRRDPRGAAANTGWPCTRSGPSGHRTHLAIGSCEGPVAGPLINLFARGMRQLANRRRTQQKKNGEIRERAALHSRDHSAAVSSPGNHNYLVARLSAHRGEAPDGGSRYSRAARRAQ